MRGKLLHELQRQIPVGITPADAGKTWMLHGISKTAQDHPRGCGENMKAFESVSAAWGSPPRMRGKLTARCGKKYPDRITPADAGKTSFSYHAMRRSRDHPRGCGENQYGEQKCDWDMGSPPRMRGKHNATHQSIADNRITPADAGKTMLCCTIPTARSYHPRGCGENEAVKYFVKPAAGSPPRMRGKHPRACCYV